MNVRELERLFRKYYGYVADLEGSGVEAFDLLFVRDKDPSLAGRERAGGSGPRCFVRTTPCPGSLAVGTGTNVRIEVWRWN